MKLLFTKGFDREYYRLVHKDRKYESKVNKTLSLMQFDLGHPSLRVHKLKNTDIYSTSVDTKIRILFMVDGDKVHLLEIGNHDEVY